MVKKFYYHGANKKLNVGDFLKIADCKSTVPQPDGKFKPAIYASDEKKKAVKYAIMHAPFQLFFNITNDRKVFIFLKESTHIYVYELESEGFQKYDDDYYVKYTDAKILKIEEIKAEDLNKLGYEVRIIKKANLFRAGIIKTKLNNRYQKYYNMFIEDPKKFEQIMDKYTTKVL